MNLLTLPLLVICVVQTAIAMIELNVRKKCDSMDRLMKNAIWAACDLNESADLENWLPNDYLAELSGTLLIVPVDFHSELEAVYNNSLKANQKIAGVLQNVTSLNGEIVANNIQFDDQITDYLGKNHGHLKLSENLKDACGLIENFQTNVNVCNEKAEKCTDDLKQNLFPMLDDINKRLDKTCRFDHHSIPLGTFQNMKYELKKLADDIYTGVIMSTPKETESFDTFENCLIDVMKETEDKLGHVFEELNKVAEGTIAVDSSTNTDANKIYVDKASSINTVDINSASDAKKAKQ